MSTKQTKPQTLTAQQRVSILRAGTVRNGYPWASATNALLLSDDLGLTWPADTDEVFTTARDALALAGEAFNAEAPVTWEMLTAPDAAEQVRHLLTARVLAESTHAIKGEAARAVAFHVLGVLSAGAPTVLDQLREYATEHADDRRFVGIAGRVPEDLAPRVQAWTKIERLQQALIDVAEGEAVADTMSVPGWSWCRFYEWTVTDWLEFSELYESPDERTANLHSFAMMRGMQVDLATSPGEMDARARPLHQATERREQERKEAASQRYLSAPRAGAHVGGSISEGSGTRNTAAAQLLGSYTGI